MAANMQMPEIANHTYANANGQPQSTLSSIASCVTVSQPAPKARAGAVSWTGEQPTPPWITLKISHATWEEFVMENWES
jgi:hypothetical protein